MSAGDGAPRVALERCESYERERVQHAVSSALDELGGPGEFVGWGSTVFLKVNGLLPASPERAITTHPEVVRALVTALSPVAGRIIIGDSPGGPFSTTLLKRMYEKTGFARVAEETGASLSMDTSVTLKQVHGAKSMKTFTLCAAMTEADHLISLPKFKTHLLTGISGAVKNVLGTVPGLTKVTYHSRYRGARRFSDLLVDVVLAAEPTLHLVDAVVGMEGNGPREGNPKHIGVIAAGSDAFAVDTVMMDVIRQRPARSSTLEAAIARGLTTGKVSDIVVLGDPVSECQVHSFAMPIGRDLTEMVPDIVMRNFGRLFTLRPRPIEGKCTACGKCVEVCPEGAIAMEDGCAVVDYSKCIRCYCCHELCEHDAIALERPVLMRIRRR
jgi:uncharacterized protein (DUF362 family)